MTVMDTTRAGTVIWTGPEPDGVQIYVDPAATDPLQAGAAEAEGIAIVGRLAPMTRSDSATHHRRAGNI